MDFVIVALSWFFSFLDVLLWAYIILSYVCIFAGRPLKIYLFVQALLDPLLKPIRALLNKSEFLRNFPIDFSVIVLFLLLDTVRRMLGVPLFSLF